MHTLQRTHSPHTTTSSMYQFHVDRCFSVESTTCEVFSSSLRNHIQRVMFQSGERRGLVVSFGWDARKCTFGRDGYVELALERLQDLIDSGVGNDVLQPVSYDMRVRIKTIDRAQRVAVVEYESASEWKDAFLALEQLHANHILAELTLVSKRATGHQQASSSSTFCFAFFDQEDAKTRTALTRCLSSPRSGWRDSAFTKLLHPFLSCSGAEQMLFAHLSEGELSSSLSAMRFLDISLTQANDGFENMRVAFARSENDSSSLEQEATEWKDRSDAEDVHVQSNPSIDRPLEKSELDVLRDSSTALLVSRIMSKVDLNTSKLQSTTGWNPSHSNANVAAFPSPGSTGGRASEPALYDALSRERDRALAFAKTTARKYARALDDLASDFHRIRNRAQQREAYFSSLSGRVEKAQQQSKLMTVQLHELKIALKAAEKENEILKEERDNWGSKNFEDLSKSLSASHKDLQKSRVRESELKEEIQAHQNNISLLRDTMRKHEEIYTKRIAELERCNVELEDHKSTLQSEVEKASTDLSQCRANAHSQAETLSKLQEELQAKTKQCKEARAQCEEAEKQAVNVEVLRVENERIKEALNNERARARDAAEELLNVKQSLALATSETNSLHALNADCKEQLALAHKQAADINQTNTKELIAAEKKINELRQKLQDTKRQKNMAHNVIEKMTRAYGKQQEELAMKQKYQLTKMREEYEERMSSLQHEYEHKLTSCTRSASADAEKALAHQKLELQKLFDKFVIKREREYQQELDSVREEYVTELDEREAFLEERLRAQQDDGVKQLEHFLRTEATKRQTDIQKLQQSHEEEMAKFKIFYEKQAKKQVEDLQKSFHEEVENFKSQRDIDSQKATMQVERGTNRIVGEKISQAGSDGGDVKNSESRMEAAMATSLATAAAAAAAATAATKATQFHETKKLDSYVEMDEALLRALAEAELQRIASSEHTVTMEHREAESAKKKLSDENASLRRAVKSLCAALRRQNREPKVSREEEAPNKKARHVHRHVHVHKRKGAS